jgi:hypothetical protein
MRLNDGKQNQLNFREMKQTAVEWLAETLRFANKDLYAEMYEHIEQAKEMEKEQIINAFEESRLTHPMIGFKHETFKDYYKKTFKTNEK